MVSVQSKSTRKHEEQKQRILMGGEHGKIPGEWVSNEKRNGVRASAYMRYFVLWRIAVPMRCSPHALELEDGSYI
jgi:hypothetical protein